MLLMHKKWRRDEGSIDFIQLIVGLMIISIAAVGTLQALYYGYEQLDFQMRHRKAVSIARAYVEYIQARVHSDIDENDFRDVYFKNGNIANPHTRLLDERDPSIDYDNIYCKVMHRPLIKYDHPDTKGFDYWKIQVIVRWNEPGETIGPEERHFVFLDARMIPAGI